MLYDTSRIKPLTEEVILSRTTEYDVFSYYIGHKFTIGSKFNSPLRKDNNPSFGIFVSKKTNSLLFKDQSTGESGNCFKFVQLKEHLSTYKQALELVDRELNSNSIVASDFGKKVSTEYKATTTNIQIKKKYFTDRDEEYWSSFGIDKTILKHFNVYPVQCVWVNEHLLPWKYTKEEPMYAYQIYNKFKIYRPLSKSHEKWLSNCNMNDIQGLQQLPTSGDVLIITKSLKDAMVLYKLGYNAVSANSENTLIPQKIINNLKNRFTHIIIFYDNDAAGMKGAEEMSKLYNLNTICIDPEYSVKDISDFVLEYGLMKANKLIKKLSKNAYNTTFTNDLLRV